MESSVTSIALKAFGNARVATDHVYFAFGSGRYGYNCIACEAKCCRGFGYNAAAGPEIQRQLLQRPDLALFVSTVDSAGAMCQVRNLTPACFFLTDEGRCRVQIDGGYRAKPETCRLFPFNHLRLVGDYLIVAPHHKLCPLEIQPLSELSQASDYDQLVKAMAEDGVSAAVRRSTSLWANVAEAIVLERRIVHLCENSLDRWTFPDLLSAIWLVTPSTASFDSPDPGYHRNSASQFIEQSAVALGIAPEPKFEPDPQLDRVMIAMTPYLRRLFVFADDDESPRAFRSVEMQRVPHALAALYIFARAARRAGMTRVTFQTISAIAQAFADIAALLSLIDQLIVWKAEADIDLSGPDKFAAPFANIARGLLPSRQARSPKIFGDLLTEACSATGFERVEFLRHVAARVLGNVAIPTQIRKQIRSTLTLRRRIQRWSLSALGEETVLAAIRGQRHA